MKLGGNEQWQEEKQEEEKINLKALNGGNEQ